MEVTQNNHTNQSHKRIAQSDRRRQDDVTSKNENETGYIETRIHSVRRRVFTLDLPKLISRKSLPKISFQFSDQRKNKK